MATTHHAEHVGSLLRPPYLLRAREAHEAGELTTAQLREVEDRAIAELLEIQEQAGLTVFTDGEARRESWRAGLLESLGGVEPASRTLRWYRDGKELSPEETLSDGAVAVTKVSREQDLTGVEARFMTEHAPGTFKITMISASMGGMIWNRERSSAVYPAPAQGGYEPVAERLFNEVPVDRFLLEYDTERAGGFEPLRFVPPGPTVVLGLVTTKVPELETRDDLLRRIDEATRYVPLEQLALSPQCGFASGSLGNLVTVDDERRKLDLVVSVAGQVWG
jgi:methionine synthase II (cobalamin-independent)